MKFKIEHGIPMDGGRRGHGEWATTFKQMKIGDSFVAPGNSRPSAYTCAKRIGISIFTQKISDNEIRIWRTK